MGYSREFLDDPQKMLRSELAKKYNTMYSRVCCNSCIYWKYNNGGVKYSNGTSKCEKNIKNTKPTSFCKYFERRYGAKTKKGDL